MPPKEQGMSNFPSLTKPNTNYDPCTFGFQSSLGKRKLPEETGGTMGPAHSLPRLEMPNIAPPSSAQPRPQMPAVQQQQQQIHALSRERIASPPRVNLAPPIIKDTPPKPSLEKPKIEVTDNGAPFRVT